MENKLTIDDLQQLMVTHGLVIRAIPYEQTFYLDVIHQNKYPDGVIEYNPVYNRQMLTITRSNTNLGGKFLIEQDFGRTSMVRFSGKKTYDSIQEAVDSILDKLKEN